MDTRTTRLPVDLIEAAESEGLAEHRSAAKQLEHWARFGLYFDRQAGAARIRIQRAIAGELPFDELDHNERTVANAMLNAAISTTANATSFADRLAARGVTTVVIDDDGRMIRRSPDGSTRQL